jgi:hypothetical protein
VIQVKDGEVRDERLGVLEGKPLSRREFFKMAGIAGAIIGTGGGLAGLLSACGGTATTTTTAANGAATTGQTTASTAAATAVGSAGSLVFPKDTFTEATATVTTADGDKEVTYRLYKHLTYVTKPVDENYQSLDVKVPTKIAGTAIDATNAPMLFDIGVGGYMSSANTADGSSNGMPGGAGGGPPAGMTGTPPAGMKGGPGGGMAAMVSNADLALAAGYVVVSPGCRGRDNKASDGTYFGKAPAAIVDLKAAVRYVRANKGVIPGNTDWIISNGTSAGGALSSLLAASGDHDLYTSYLKELGAADASDAIFGCAAFCPITDLEHADMAYEWQFGAVPVSNAQVDQTMSQELAAAFAAYQASLNIQGLGGFGTLAADNYGDYLLKTYLVPAANTYLAALSEADRQSYLSTKSWITWDGTAASFSFADYSVHCGRMKGLPAFDAFDLSAAENVEFGTETVDARHFTAFSLKQASGGSAKLDSDLPDKIDMMNPMYFVTQKNAGAAGNYWIRYGTSDANTSLPVIANLAAGMATIGKNVNSLMYWDAGHGANQDSADLMKWIGSTTGYQR